ncbi:MAG: VOC family protein [Candidatus Marinimicrobia bacterium]|nr:VOC family protein [Candidatus Neomarinimicrobiota bacterium]MCF7829949.1 VOC family protein [Candidatus Neomarinimicrobiota bacterium]MCF7881897.1 VOC family protein [Candidatus Neomarinimicrobiota bacterium]
MESRWPKRIPATQVRWTRFTSQLERIMTFYKEGLGLPELGASQDEEGRMSILFGLPGFNYHLEFIEQPAEANMPDPLPDHSFEFYIPDDFAYEDLIERLADLGHEPHPKEDSRWGDNAAVYHDPDGFRVVICNSEGV